MQGREVSELGLDIINKDISMVDKKPLDSPEIFRNRARYRLLVRHNESKILSGFVRADFNYRIGPSADSLEFRGAHTLRTLPLVATMTG